MRVLVTGAAGLLGSNVVTTARRSGDRVLATYHSTSPDLGTHTERLDICDNRRFESLLDSFQPDVVVNCAAMTDVNGCQREPERSMAVNGNAPGRLASAATDAGIDFVHISTDYVFDGRSTSRYTEPDRLEPIQAYGHSKLVGERAVADAHPRSIIVRLSFVYGYNTSNDSLEGFPAWVLGRLETGEETPLFTDQYVTPTRAGAAAETLLALARGDVAGLYHVAAKDCVTPYEFGRQVATRIDAPADCLIPGSLTEVERHANRPRYSCLDVTRVESTLGREQPTISEDLDTLHAAGYMW